MPTYEEALQDPDIVGLDAIAPHPNFLVFGGSGAGKTVLGGSDDRVLFITIEAEGTLSSRRMGSTAKQVICNHWDDVDAFYEKAAKWAESDTGIPFTWFVFDSLTVGQDMLMDKILEDRGKEIEEWPDYRRNQKLLLRTVKRFNALPVNMLWLALDRLETDPDGETFYCPEIHGKGYSIAMQVAAQMTSYGYLQVSTEKVDRMKDGKPVLNEKTKKPLQRMVSHRDIYWQDIQTLRGKDRTLALAPRTRDLTLKQIRLKVEAAFAKEVPTEGDK